MNYKENADIIYNLESCQDLANKIYCIKRGLPYKEKDARIYSLNQFRSQFMTTVHFGLSFINSFKECLKEEKKNNLNILLTLLSSGYYLEKFKLEGLLQLLSDYEHNIKVSFLTITQFVVENMIRNVLFAVKEIKTEDNRLPFKSMISKILDYIKIENKEEKKRILILPAYIRNTLHCDGIHTKDNFSIIIDRVEYNLEKDKRVNCGSWSHIFLLYSKCIDIYEEILKHNEILKINFIKVKEI